MKKLLIVDDYIDVHEIISLIFEDDDIEIKALQDIDGFYEAVDNWKPDMMLLDVNIGRFDGRDICNQLKENDNTKHIKVVLMSATAVDFMKYPCKPDAYFEKPFEIAEVRSLVLGLLQERILY